MLRCAGTLLLLVWLSACSLPEQQVGFESDVAEERIQALARAVREDDRSKIPELIELLESPDPADRMLAIRTLERWTGNTLGYDYAASEARRREAVERWIKWTQDEGHLDR